MRALLPRAFILVTGYGSQGARGRDAAVCFNSDGMGAFVSSSRGITYAYPRADLNRASFAACVRENTTRMIDDLSGALKR